MSLSSVMKHVARLGGKGPYQGEEGRLAGWIEAPYTKAGPLRGELTSSKRRVRSPMGMATRAAR